MKIARWILTIMLLLLSFTPVSFSGVQPICPTCGRIPPCPTNPLPTDPPCDPSLLSRPAPDPEPTPTPTPTPQK